MTKKVTGNDLKKLLEGVLSEEMEIPYDIGNNRYTGPVKKKMAALSGYGTTAKRNKALFNKLMGLAELDPPERMINREDLKDYLELNLDPSEIINSVAKELKTEKKEGVITGLTSAFADVENSLLTDEGLKALFTSKDRKQIDRALRALSSTNSNLKKRAATAFVALADESNTTVPELRQTLSTGTVEDVDPTQQPFGRAADPSSLPKSSLETTGDDFKSGSSVKADRNIVNQFRSIGGSSIIEKLDELKAFGAAVNGGENGISGWLKSHNEFDLINYSAVLSMLADISKEYSAIESGYQFERWLALFMNMPVVGGENGMADNLAKATKGGTIYTSAKMVKNPCSISQALSNFKAQFEQSQDPVYYFSVQKKGDRFGPASSYTNISDLVLYLIKIVPDEEQNDLPYKGQLIGSNGSPKSPEYGLKIDPGSPTKVLIMPCTSRKSDAEMEQYAFFSIPTLPEVSHTGEMVQTAANFLAGEIEKSTAEISKKMISAYKSLQKVEQNTDNYRSVKGKGETMGTASDYIKAINTDYGAFKALMNDVFVSQDEEEKINESKKVTSDSLKKLFSESFKR